MDALLSTGANVTIGGKDYPMRRLGIRDVFKVAKIFAKLGSAVVGDLTRAGGNVEAMGFILISAVPECEDQVVELLASLLSIEVKEFDTLPLEALPAIIMKLAESEDLKSFLAQVAKLVETFSPKTPETEKAESGS